MMMSHFAAVLYRKTSKTVQLVQDIAANCSSCHLHRTKSHLHTSVHLWDYTNTQDWLLHDGNTASLCYVYLRKTKLRFNFEITDVIGILVFLLFLCLNWKHFMSIFKYDGCWRRSQFPLLSLMTWLFSEVGCLSICQTLWRCLNIQLRCTSVLCCKTNGRHNERNTTSCDIHHRRFCLNSSTKFCLIQSTHSIVTCISSQNMAFCDTANLLLLLTWLPKNTSPEPILK